LQGNEADISGLHASESFCRAKANGKENTERRLYSLANPWRRRTLPEDYEIGLEGFRRKTLAIWKDTRKLRV